MKKLMSILFLSCFKATELVEKKLQNKLSLTEGTQLCVHKAMCKACKVYEKQSIIIEKSLDLQNSKEPHVDNEDLKKKILESLKNSVK